MEEDEIATRELINWGILERNRANEVIPTADFLIWLYEQKGNAMVGLEEYNDDSVTDEEKEEFLEDEVRNAIHTWTMQVIRGRSIVEKLDIDVHVKTVCEMILGISDRLMEVYMKKTKNRGTEEERKVWAKEMDDELEEWMKQRKSERLKQKEETDRRKKEEAARGQKKLGDFQ